MTKEIKIVIGIAVVVIAGGILLFKQQPSNEAFDAAADAGVLVRETSHATTTGDAKVTVVEFGDYECPACAAAEPAFEQLRQEYQGDQNVKFVFRNFPLPQHQKALASAAAAEAAGDQGKFWEMHDKLYQNQQAWTGAGDHVALFTQYAKDIGLDTAVFTQAWQQNGHAGEIKADQQDGETLGVNSTPTFFINGKKTNGYSYNELKSTIEQGLQ